MKKFLTGVYSLSVFFMLLFLGSCRGIDFKNAELTEAERIINTYPDSALGMIERIDASELTETDHARYVYLRTRACDKLHRPITWPDEMQSAADHLDGLLQGYRDTLALVHYYTGIAHMANRRPKDAVAGFLKSLEYQGTAPSRIGMMTYSNLSDCYWDQDLNKEAKESIYRSLDIAQALNDTYQVRMMYKELAMSYGIQHELDSALYFGYKALSVAIELNDSLSLASTYHNLSAFYRVKCEYDSALHYSNKAFLFYPKGIAKDEAFFFSRSALYVQLGERDSAFFYLKDLLNGALPQLKYDVYQQMYELEKNTGHFTEASIYADSVIYYRKLLSEEDHSQEIKDLIVAHRDALRRKEQEQFYYIISFVIVGLVMLVVVVYLFMMNRSKKKMLAKNQELSELRARIVALKGEVASLREEEERKMEVESPSGEAVSETMSQDAAATAMLAQEILELQQHQIALCAEMLQRRPEYDELEALRVHPSPVVTNERRDLLVNAIVNAFSDVYQELLSEYPTLNNQDCLYCLMSYMNYGTKLCAALTGNSEEAVRQRKYRIKKRIKPEAFDFFFGK